MFEHIFHSYTPDINIYRQSLSAEFSIRKLNEDDFLSGTQYDILSQLTTTVPLSNEKINQFLSLINPTLHYIIGVFHNDNLISMATLFLEPKLTHGGSFVGHIEDVVVDRAYRNRGIGKTMILNLVEIGQLCGCYKVMLDTATAQLPFYEKCGFEVKEHHCAKYFE